jgi:hypothetical protein
LTPGPETPGKARSGICAPYLMMDTLVEHHGQVMVVNRRSTVSSNKFPQ